MMKRQRQPLMWSLPLALLAMWLMLNDSLALGQWLLGIALVMFVILTSASMRPLRARLRRPWVMVRLAVHVLIDITRSNFEVLGIILGPAERRRHGGFLEIPLDLRDPHGLAMLAAIVTSTPGTVWADLSADGTVLTLHVLELKDREYWLRTIKQRYERPLMEIFE
jgi:multicomponent K+:H+ antiporter subunit E